MKEASLARPHTVSVRLYKRPGTGKSQGKKDEWLPQPRGLVAEKDWVSFWDYKNILQLTV